MKFPMDFFQVIKLEYCWMLYDNTMENKYWHKIWNHLHYMNYWKWIGLTSKFCYLFFSVGSFKELKMIKKTSIWLKSRLKELDNTNKFATRNLEYNRLICYTLISGRKENRLNPIIISLDNKGFLLLFSSIQKQKKSLLNESVASGHFKIGRHWG